MLVCLGPMVTYGRKVAAMLREQLGLSVTVINARFASPLDKDLLAAELPKYRTVCTIEDHALNAGFGSAVLELVNDCGITLQTHIKRFGVGEDYVPHASQAEQHAMNGYDPLSIFKYIRSVTAVKIAAAG